MNKSQLIDVVSKDAGLKRKDAEAAVNSVISAIETALAGTARRLRFLCS